MQPLALPRPLPADLERCHLCGGKLGQNRIATRDKDGNARRFCIDSTGNKLCFEIWARHNLTAFNCKRVS